MLKPQTKEFISFGIASIVRDPVNVMILKLLPEVGGSWEGFMDAVMDPPEAVPPHLEPFLEDMRNNREEVRRMFAAVFAPETVN